MTAKPSPTTIAAKTKEAYYYMDVGDSVYKLRNHLNNFAASMRYYDTALMIATEIHNDSLMMDTYESLASAYDAWNKQPEKTIYYYKKEIEIALKINRYYNFIGVFLAEAYFKNGDSANTIQSIIFSDQHYRLIQANKHASYNKFYADLAYLAACVKNYPLAKHYLAKLYNPSSYIKNTGVNHRFHYLIAQCEIHFYDTHTDIPAWLDTAKQMITDSKNLSDSLYQYQFYILSLQHLGYQDSAAKYLAISEGLDKKFGNTTTDSSKAKNSFLEHQIKESEKDKQLAILEKKNLQQISLLLFAILISVSIAVFLILRNRKKIAQKNKELAALNVALDKKAAENLLMVKEMHHRVKNNLYLMYSLLEMQGRRTNNSETQEQLAAARNRIESIAITHEQLYKNQEEDVNMQSYLQTFINSIISSNAGTKQLVPVIDIDPQIVLPTYSCLPLAMLLNEWLTNSAKHADTDDDKVYIHVTATLKNETITIAYHDSGNPLPYSSTESTEGLGSKIITLLCKQLKAQLIKNYNNQLFHYQIVINKQQMS